MTSNRRRPLVEELEAYVLLSNVFTVTSNTDDGSGTTNGTLSWAIDRVNGDHGDSTSNPDEIAFDVGGGGAQTIAPTATLPPITAPVVVDGETEPGYSTTTYTPLVRLDGSSEPDYATGLLLLPGAEESTIEGLDVTDFGDGNGGIEIDSSNVRVIANDIGLTTAGAAAPNDVGLVLIGTGNTIGGVGAAGRNVISGNTQAGIVAGINGLSTSGNLIEGNDIGTDPTGTKALPNVEGILVIEASENTIGGVAAGAGNLISGNTGPGIDFDGNDQYDGPTTGNVVEGNLIGTDESGARPLANGAGGINIVSEADGNTIGGLTAGAGNTIAGNGEGGVLMNGASGNLVEGNFIGTDAAGDSGVGNSGDGVYIAQQSSNNTVGGAAAGAGNTIADNEGNGVTIGYEGDISVGDAVLGNSIFGNTTLGIDLGDDGVTLNDSEGHSGPNLLQDFPVIDSATFSASNTVVAGTLAGTAGDTYTIQVFADATSDPSGYGQGETYLGDATATADGSGVAHFTVTGIEAPAGQAVVSATATDSSGDTSEFSQVFPYVPTNPLEVTNTSDSGPGSLRSAILYANTKSSLQDITFAIPGSGVQTIQPLTPLPVITTPVTIDGESQPGYAGTPLIRLDGGSAGAYSIGITLFPSSSGSTIEGLDVTDFGPDGTGISIDGGVRIVADDIGVTTDGVASPNALSIAVDGAGNTIGGVEAIDRDVISGNTDFGIYISGYNSSATGNVVEGDYIGTDPTGSKAVANDWGIGIIDGVSNTIGGTADGAGNVLSGNTEAGIYIDGNELYGGVTTGNVVEGNLIGLDATGNGPLGNVDLGGIYVAQQASGNTIGGAAAGAGNTIASNGNGGVLLNQSSGNLIEGNIIGTDLAGDAGLGNSGDGVLLGYECSDDTVGGTSTGAGNVIADNRGNGVTVGYEGDDIDDSVGDAIEGNSIFGNTGIGIDLGDDGVTPNDSSEGHSGPNLLQDFPDITSAEVASGGGFAIAGTVEGPKSTNVTVSIYADPSADPSGHGQGQIYLGSVQVPIGPSGTGTISGFSTTVTLHTGEVITATTTDAAGDTSEFSADVAIVPGPDIITPMVRVQASGFSVSRSTHQYTQTFTITNTSGSAIAGPVYLELDDLPSGVTLLTSSTPAPDGKGPAVEVSSGGLGVGQSVTVTLAFSNPANIVINYVPELLGNPFGGNKN